MIGSAYQWWLFLHITGVLAFVMAHGVSAGVALQLRHERNPDRIRALLQLSNSSTSVFYVGILLLVVAGIALGFQIRAWGQGWIWTAIVVLFLTMAAMYAVATPYYRRVRRVMQIHESGGTAVGADEIEQLMRSGRPGLILLIGAVPLLFILYLMVLKPF
jgi:ABC-type dipeptide/oligopeptide/nickel transport system permease component